MNTITKRVIAFILIFYTFFLSVNAHPGRTDSNGGHFVGGSNEYHYHHGEPEHQHPDGKCPYEPSGFSEFLSKILFFIAGILVFPLYVNMLLFGLISIPLEFISSKFKKAKPTPEEQLLIDERNDKIYSFVSIILFIIEVIVFSLIIFQW